MIMEFWWKVFLGGLIIAVVFKIFGSEISGGIVFFCASLGLAALFLLFFWVSGILNDKIKKSAKKRKTIHRDQHMPPDKKCRLKGPLALGVVFILLFLISPEGHTKDLGDVKALIKVKAAVEKYPDSVKAHMEYQDAMIKDGWRDQMIAEYTKRLQERGELPENIFLLARVHEDKDKQAAQYDELVKTYPEFIWGYYGQAYVAWKKGDKEKAKTLFGRVIEIGPKEPSAYTWLAFFAQGEDDINKALDITTKGLALAGEDAELLGYHATLLRLSGKKAEALDLIHKILALNPDDEIGLRQLGFVYTDLNRLEEAVEARKKYLMLWPRYGAIWGQLCQNLFALYDKTKDLSMLIEAEEACCKSVEVSPKDVDPYLMAIDFFNDREWWVHGLYYCHKALGIMTPENPSYKAIEHNLSWIPSQRIGGPHYDIEVIKPADPIQSQDGLRQNENGLADAEAWVPMSQKDAKNIEDNSAIIEQFPEFAVAYYNRGIVRIKTKEGRKDLETAVSLSPSWARARAALTAAYILEKNYRAARNSLKAALELDSEDFMTRYNAGLMEMFDEAVVGGTVKQLRELAEAVKAGANINLDTFEVFAAPFERYLTRDPTSPEIEEAFGDIFFSHNNAHYWAAALTHYKKAVELGGNPERLMDKISTIENQNKAGEK